MLKNPENCGLKGIRLAEKSKQNFDVLVSEGTSLGS
jgi:hypothetical protein